MVKRSEHDSKKPDKSELLRELETIRDTLIDDFIKLETAHTSSSITNKTTVNENIETASTMQKSSDSTENKPHTATKPSESALDGQQSLFEESSSVVHDEHTDLNSENPFLPSHIKERLNKEKTSLQNLQNEALRHLAGQTNTDQLIDEVIQQFMPEIEAELRRRLNEKFNPTQSYQTNESSI